MSAHSILKARTARAHAMIDMAFSRFNLASRSSYISFLLSHARVLPAIEDALKDQPSLPPWRPRTGLLMQDLETLGVAMPASVVIHCPFDLAKQFGLLYVIEGSRFGGRLLLRRIGPGFPSRYLAATHAPGEWPTLIEALEMRAAREDETWLEAVVAGARHGFQFYAQSARQASAS